MHRDKKVTEYLNQVKAIFPELDVASARSIFNGKEPNSGEIIFTNESIAFKNRFKHTGKLIHYTTIDALINILNSEEIRLYNCQNLNDKLELNYAIKELGIDIGSEQIELFRQNFFLFSACQYDENTNDEDFNLWRLYSNSGLGAAIVFEVVNYEDYWDNVFFGKVEYGINDKANNDLIRFIDLHQKFNKKYNLFENIPSLIPAIGLHFKNPIWNIEKEVRLITYCPFDKYTFEARYFENGNPFLQLTRQHSINREGKLTSYVRLPLNPSSTHKYFKLGSEKGLTDRLLEGVPNLKIAKIILGYKISPNTFFAVSKILEQSFSKSYGYDIDLQYSKYKELN